MNKDQAIGFGIGLLAGAVVGGTIALLYAPQSGKETRAMLKGKATGVVDAIKGKSSGVVDVAEDVASEASRRGHAAVHGPKS